MKQQQQQQQQHTTKNEKEKCCVIRVVRVNREEMYKMYTTISISGEQCFDRQTQGRGYFFFANLFNSLGISQMQTFDAHEKWTQQKKKKNSALRTMMKIHSAALWIVNFQRLHLEIWQKDVAYNLRYGVLFAPIILHNFHLICNIAVFAEVDVDAPLRPARSSDNWNRSQCCWCWCCFFLPLSGRTQQNCNVKLEIHNHLCWFQNHNLRELYGFGRKPSTFLFIGCGSNERACVGSATHRALRQIKSRGAHLHWLGANTNNVFNNIAFDVIYIYTDVL